MWQLPEAYRERQRLVRTAFWLFVACAGWFLFCLLMLVLAGFRIIQVQNITLMGLIASTFFSLMAYGGSMHLLLKHLKSDRMEPEWPNGTRPESPAESTSKPGSQNLSE